MNTISPESISDNTRALERVRAVDLVINGHTLPMQLLVRFLYHYMNRPCKYMGWAVCGFSSRCPPEMTGDMKFTCRMGLHIMIC